MSVNINAVGGTLGVALVILAGTLVIGQTQPPAPVVCDITQTAFQSPGFIDHYFNAQFQGQRSHTDEHMNVLVNGTFVPARLFEYVPVVFQGHEEETGPAVCVAFSHGRVILTSVEFKQRQTLSDTARRVGLRLSALQFRGTSFHSYQLHYSGTYRGVVFKDLMITNPASGIGRVIEATFAGPTVTQAKASAV